MPRKRGRQRLASTKRAAPTQLHHEEADHSKFPDLPQYPGSKLHVFEHHMFPIEWLERLDVDREGIQGYVFRAKINSTLYAIKVFKPYDIEEDRGYCEGYLGSPLNMHEVLPCMDPFFLECRAYGAILNERRKRNVKMNIALPCYGYIELKEEDEKILKERGFDIRNHDEPGTGSEPKTALRAIVKKLADPERGITTRRPKEILNGVKALNRIKVYNRDLRLDNFLNAQIVDFGSAWTEPHVIMEAADEEELEGFRKEDLGLYDQMVEGEEFNTSTRALFQLPSANGKEATKQKTRNEGEATEKPPRYNLRNLAKLGNS